MAYRNRHIKYPPFPDSVHNAPDPKLESSHSSPSTTNQPPVSNISLFSPVHLPSGWISQIDSTGTRHFYIHRATGRRQWDVPTHTPTTKPHSPSLVFVPTPRLPPGWITQKDSTGTRHFYIHPPSGRSQWEVPTCAVPKTSVPSPYINPYFQQQTEEGIPNYYFPMTNSYSKPTPTSFGTSAGSAPADYGGGWNRNKENLVSYVVPSSAVEVQFHTFKAQTEVWHPSEHLAKLVSVSFRICDLQSVCRLRSLDQRLSQSF